MFRLTAALALLALATPTLLAQPAIRSAEVNSDGEALYDRVCATCHNATVEGPRKLGPTMHGVVGRKVASVEGFRYSTAKRDADLVWTPDKLNPYLLNPREFMPGTTMAYAGLKNDTDRANVIAYLQTLK